MNTPVKSKYYKNKSSLKRTLPRLLSLGEFLMLYPNPNKKERGFLGLPFRV
jgi:hypothetical protein